MSIRACFYDVIRLPMLDDEQLHTFSTLPIDPYCGGNQRYRRFSQYAMEHDGSWVLEKLDHRPFIQSVEYNSFVGGVPRNLEPVEIDPTVQFDAAAEAIGLDRLVRWQVNLHQCRVVANSDAVGTSVPEGPHRDGHEIGMVAVFARHNVAGGATQLLHNDSNDVFFEHALQPCEAVAYDDSALKHFATDIEPVGDQGGHRDLWIVAFNRWEHRRYGTEFEARALSGAGR